MSVLYRARHALLGIFAADAAAPGLHWIYDVDEVRRRGGDRPELAPASRNPYHGRRGPGALTHYGDHALIVLESLVERGGLDPDDYRARYLARFGAADYDGYLDHATKELLAQGRGADDDQAGAFTKLAPLVVRYLEDRELDDRLEEAIRLTHDHPAAVSHGLAAAAAIRAAVRGAGPDRAVAAAAERGGDAGERARAALAGRGDPIAFALRVGQACSVTCALPVALHAALHGPDFAAAVRTSLLSGGDSAGRLFVTAAIRGATDGVPAGWLERVAGRARLEELVDRLLEQAALPERV